MDIDKRITELKGEFQNTFKEMQSIKSQIVQLNKKGECLAQQANTIKGKIEAFEEMRGNTC
jgi:uncharacterized coiled-coil DUF342 family protein